MDPANKSPEAAASGVVWLWVPFGHKDEARALGAKWDRQAHAWYVPPGVDAAPFAPWARRPTAETAPQRQPGREYLDVPYGERKAAKAAGAAWDAAARCWYVGPQADRQRLARWQADAADGIDAAQAADGQSVREAFAAALRAMGCVVSGEHPVMDGQRHGIGVDGVVHTDAAANDAAFYVVHLEGRPHGYIRNFRTGIDMQWKARTGIH